MTAIAGGCTNGESIRHLDLAESCMNSYPELALRTIDSIDTRFLLSRSRKARYALLKTMALDKNFIDYRCQFHSACGGVLCQTRFTRHEVEIIYVSRKGIFQCVSV